MSCDFTSINISFTFEFRGHKKLQRPKRERHSPPKDTEQTWTFKKNNQSQVINIGVNWSKRKEKLIVNGPLFFVTVSWKFDVEWVRKPSLTLLESVLKLVKWPSVRVVSFKIAKI